MLPFAIGQAAIPIAPPARPVMASALPSRVVAPSLSLASASGDAQLLRLLQSMCALRRLNFSISSSDIPAISKPLPLRRMP